MSDQRLMLSADKLRMLIAFMLLFPLFFQVSEGVFRDPSMYFDSGGVLSRLPIPLSVIACYGGILVLGAYKRASLSLSFVFFTCVLTVTSTILATQGEPVQEQGKFILVVQFILPTLALVLGQLYEVRGNNSVSFEKVFLYILATLVPLQLLFSWVQGKLLLSPYFYVFSIYQHLQYVPVIFVCCYLIALYALWKEKPFKKTLFILAPLMGIYAAASFSMLATFVLVVGALGLAAYQWKRSDKWPMAIFLLVLAACFGYLNYGKELFAYKFTFLNATNEQVKKETNEQVKKELQQINKIAPNLGERIRYWRYYGENVASSPKVFLFGHAERLERSQYPSAHNYYLDFVYNFGILALLPMLAVISYTFVMIYQYRREIIASPSLFGLAAVVIFLLIADNSLKVGLRQPYPGIITFFLWGVLLTRLSGLSPKQAGRPVTG